MTNIYLNPMQAIAATNNPTPQPGGVNNCKLVIYNDLSKTKTKSTRRKTLILAVLFALLAPVAAQAQFGGGTGRFWDPYIIATTDQWLALADSVNSGNDYIDKYFRLDNDLDFEGIIDFNPIGGAWLDGDYTYFRGTFDGDNHHVLNVRVGGTSNIGLFGCLDYGTVKNLTLGGNSRIEGKLFVGGIAGMAGACNIINCHVEKTVTIAATANQSSYIGGIIGSCYNATSGSGREIRYCTNAATVTKNGNHGVEYIGGIAGEIASWGQAIRDCKNYGAVSGYEYVGGIVGFFKFNQPGNTLENCYTGGYCTLYGVGQSGSSQGINWPGQAVSMHTITFGENVQGLVNVNPTADFEGQNYYAAGRQIILNLFPDSGTPEGYLARFYLNGVQQLTGNDIEITMPAENVTVTSSNPVRDIGYSPWVSVALSQESFDYDGSAQVPTVTVTDTKDGTSVTLTEGIDYEVISPANPVSPGIYTLTINGLGSFGGTVTRQYSIMTPDMWPGFGTEAKPYLILTTGHLDQLADSVNSGKDQSGVFFRLDADLDYSVKPYVTIGTFDYQFKGTFNGNGHSISNVVIQANDDYQALFGCIGAGGSVSGLTLGEGSSIEGANYVGGIAARCHGTVINCGTAEGVTIRAVANAGGIVGMLDFDGSIANCQNRADVYSDTNRSGGIVGYIYRGEVSGCINYGSVENGNSTAGGIAGELAYGKIVKDCVNEGSVSGRYPVGGIVGKSEGGISNCLNLGSVVTSFGYNYQIGGIAGFKGEGSVSNVSNSYYAGACSVGGINGNDVAGQAMRGYTVSGESGLAIGLIGTPGLVYNGVIYAGKNESITISITPPVGYVPQHGYYSFVGGLVLGKLVQNGDGWTLVMPNNMNVTINGVLALALTVPGYGESTDAGWRLIASPVMGSMRASEVGNLVPSDLYSIYYDLYRFDQSEELEWRNYKADPFVFTIENGKGYLYATKEEQTLIFAGTYNEAETHDVPLVYDANASFAGWNLVGNPFPVEAYANRSYYTMNADGTGIEPVAVSSETAIPVCTGVMVKADGANESVTFSRTAPEAGPSQGNIQIAVAQAGTRANAVEDKAIVSFNEADQLGKFVFNEDNAKLYIPQGGKDYAIAVVDRDVARRVSTEIPVNFKAAKNGTYALTVNVENMDLDYLHLIDNMTGADVDLLGDARHCVSTAYTFTAKTTDYASRFRLVFSTNCGDAIGDNAPFAYVSNGNIVVVGDAVGDAGTASLQVVDLMGRVLVCRDAFNASAISTTGIPAGVYVLRLVDGENVRTQKVVID